jgi:hypothetical protein
MIRELAVSRAAMEVKFHVKNNEATGCMKSLYGKVKNVGNALFTLPNLSSG